MKPEESSLAGALVAVLLTVALTSVGAAPATAQTFTSLFSFDVTDGAEPRYLSLVQGADGDLYGDLPGGADGYGEVFKITPGGALTVLFSFDQTDGQTPWGGLVLATDGYFYGTTAAGGTNKTGTIFKTTAGGTLTTLYNFCTGDNCASGGGPFVPLIQGTDGNLYGSDTGGVYGYGTIFKITTGGTLTTLHSFDFTDGYGPWGMIQGADGNFYGTTQNGGANSGGTVFKMSSSGALTTLYSFCATPGCTDGKDPVGALVQATNGNFYGMTEGGGANGEGTVFKITSAGVLTTLNSFCGKTDCADGEYPQGALIQGTDGNFYGATGSGGAHGEGTVFKITSAGVLTTLYSFCPDGDGCTDGAEPEGGLVQATNGIIYGTTYAGGLYDQGGTVFSMNVGLGAFVKTVPASGAVGTAVTILGTDLSGATSVKFNGTAATFTVVSGTEITTKVPTGATTGTVKVVTPSGTLSSNVAFRVP